MELMNPLYTLLIPVTVLATYDVEHYSFWDRMAERWGIGLVGLVACYAIARWTMRREDVRESKKEAKDKEEKEEREKREAAWNTERAALLVENNRLVNGMMEHLVKHAGTLEQLTRDQIQVAKDQTKAANDQAIEIKALARRMVGKPCVMQVPPDEQ